MRAFFLLMACCCAPLFRADAQEPKLNKQVTSLQIAPAKAPIPALKYRLLPGYFDMTQGDALASYLKCFMEQQSFYFSPEGMKTFETYNAAKLDDLPADVANFCGSSIRNAYTASRMDHIDWIAVTPLKRDGVMTLLPEMQNLRLLATALKIRARGQVKAGKYDDAVETVQTIFALARHLDRHPTVIGNLVGAAVASQAFQPLEEMAQRGGPNLFWAFAYLPTPMLDFRNGIEGELQFFEYEFGDLWNKDKAWDADAVAKAKAKMDLFMPMILADYQAGVKGGDALRSLVDKAKDESWLAGCRTRLKDAGYDPKKVEKFPAEQLVYHDFFRKYEVARDEMFKYAKYPNALFETLSPKPKQGSDGLDRVVDQLVHNALPRIRVGQLKFAQRLAMLQIVEGFRMYAATEGKLPTALADMNLPLPVDPVSSSAFQYELKDGKATLKGAIPKIVQETGGNVVEYQIELKK